MIAAMRKSRRSQNGWAFRIGVSPSYLSRLVNGKRRYPGRKVRDKLLAALDLSLEELCETEKVHTPARGPVPPRFESAMPLQVHEWEKRLPMLDTFTKDLRFGLRMLLRKPGFTVAAVLALALGVGANTAIFTVLNAVVLRPLPYPNADRLVMLWAENSVDGVGQAQLSPVNFMDYRRLDQVFEDATAWWYPEINLTDEQDEPVRVETIEVAANFLEVMGVTPFLGSGFPADEGLFAREQKVLISHRLWQARYLGDQAVIGQSVNLNGRPNVIVGVMPVGFNFPGQTDVWQRLIWDMRDHSRGAHFMEAVGRMVPGMTLDQANRELAGLATRLEEEFTSTNKDWRARAVGLQDEIVGDFSEAVVVLFCAVSLLLLLDCANVANLMLARATSRDRELAVRAAIGASRGRLFRQFLTESLVLGVAGSAAGLIVAQVSLQILRRTAVGIPRIESVQIDALVLAFCLTMGLVTTLVFGMLPAFQTASTELQQVLVDGGRGGSSGGRAVARNLLVVAEVGLAVVLLAGAGLLIRSFSQLLNEDTGFEPTSVVSLNIQLPRATYQDYQRVSRFYTDLLHQLQTQPGVASAGASGFLPFENGWRIPFVVEGRPAVDAAEEPIAQYTTITPGYLETLSVPLLKGRMLDFRDDAQGVPVVVINQAMARRYWAPDDDPIDDVFVSRTNGIGPLGTVVVNTYSYRIAGVVGDVKNSSLTQEAEPAVFFSHQQFPYRSMNLVVRGQGSTEQLVGAARTEIRRLDAQLAVSNIQTLEEVVRATVAQPRFVMLLMAGFAALALVLAAVGIYGVLSYAVGERRREIGIRMALGARAASVQRLVVGETIRWTLLGMGIGLVAALAAGRLMSSLLYGVNSTDSIALGGVVLGTLLVSLVARYLPVRRASSIDPLIALRSE